MSSQLNFDLGEDILTWLCISAERGTRRAVVVVIPLHVVLTSRYSTVVYNFMYIVRYLMSHNRIIFDLNVKISVYSILFVEWRIYTVFQKVYYSSYSTTNDDFDSSCPIPLPVILIQILLSKYAIERYSLISHLTRLMFVPYLGNFKTLKITNSAIMEHLVRINEVNHTSSFVHNLLVW